MKNKKNIIIIFGLLFSLIIVVGISYGFFVYNKDVANISLNTGQISIDFLGVSGSNSLTNIIPKSDYEGKKSTDYIDFSVTGTADIDPILYEIQIIPTSNNINERYIRLYLTDQNDTEIISPYSYNELYTGMNNNGKALYQDLIEGNIDGTSKTTTSNYRLRVWIDEKFPDTTPKSFDFDINLYAKNVDKANLEKVTFNSNDERENGLVKYVTKGESYGSLPSLNDREGYIFRGWNGKNLFDYQEILSNNPNTVSQINLNDVQTISWLNNVNVSKMHMLRGYFKDNTIYTLSGKIASSQENHARLVLNYSDATSSTIYYDSQILLSDTFYNTTFTSPINSSILSLRGSHANNERMYLDINSFQIEEGDQATTYEPFFVNNSITVTQEDDHDLNGIWEWNNYRFNDMIQDRSELWSSMNRSNEYLSGYGDFAIANLGAVNDLSRVSMQVTTKTNALNSKDSGIFIVGNIETGGEAIFITSSASACGINHIGFEVYLNGYGYVPVYSQNTIDTESIHDYAGVYDGSTLKLYIDGVLDNTTDLSGIISTNNLDGTIKNPDYDTIMRIGCNPYRTGCDSNSQFYTGNVYSVRIYDYPITQGKIRDNIRNDGFVE